MLPVLLGLAYFNGAHYRRQWATGSMSSGLGAGEIGSNAEPLSNYQSAFGVDSIELVFSNGLALLSLLQIGANLLGHKLSKVLS